MQGSLPAARFRAPVIAMLFSDSVDAGSESAGKAHDLGVRCENDVVIVPSVACAAFAQWVGFKFEVAWDAVDDGAGSRRELRALARLYDKIHGHDPRGDAVYVTRARSLVRRK